MMRLDNAPYIGFDTETTGLYYPRDTMFGFSVATPDGQSKYFDIRRNPRSIEWFNDEMSRFNGIIIAHNAAFDAKMAIAGGLNIDLEKLDDTCTRACLIDEKLREYTLDYLCGKYLGEKKEDIYVELSIVFGGRPTRNVQIQNLKNAHPDIVGKYAAKDALLALRLWEWQKTEIMIQGVEKICEFERRLLPSLVRAQMKGIRVDTKAAEKAIDDITVVYNQRQKELNNLAGFDVNVNSSPQIKKIFNPRKIEDIWVSESGKELGTASSGGPSIDSETLRSMDDPKADLIVEIRSLLKTRDTFLAKHVLEHEVNGRVYPNINQNKSDQGGTGTGRLSYNDPAMQQIPSRNKKVASIVKPVFLPDEGMVWVDADMHSFEVRVFAHLVNDDRIIQQYKDNPESDFHQMVANMTGLPRSATYAGQANAKQLNLSMIFNSGNGAIAEKMGMPWEWSSFSGKDGKVTYKQAGPDAMAVIDDYHRKLPGVKVLAEKAKQIALDRGYIKTNYGRKFRFPNGYKAYKASGIAIQMTAADINKNNWMVIEEALEGNGRLVLNTHDSYSMSLPENWKDSWNRVKERVENSYPWFRVPLILELSGAGNNWWEAVK